MYYPLLYMEVSAPLMSMPTSRLGLRFVPMMRSLTSLAARSPLLLGILLPHRLLLHFVTILSLCVRKRFHLVANSAEINFCPKREGDEASSPAPRRACRGVGGQRLA